MTTDRRRQILNEATSLFARRGFVGTSIRQIARKCGITEAAIYRHFPGKLRLYEEVIRAKSAEHDITGYLADKRGCGSILDALIAVSSHIMTLTREDPGLMRLMFNNAFESGDVSTVLFQEIRQPYIDFLGNEFEERMRSGEIIRIEALLTGRCFVGMVMDCALNLGTWDALYPSRGEPLDIHTNTAKIFATGLLARNRALPSQDSPDQRRTT